MTAATVSFNHAHDLPRFAAAGVPVLVDRMKQIVGPGNVLTQKADLAVYECDGFTIDKNTPDVVVFPNSTEEVAAVVRACNELDVPFVARGAGTSLAGGCVPVGGGVMIGTARMKKILEVNVRDRYAVVEAGVVEELKVAALAGMSNPRDRFPRTNRERWWPGRWKS
ncbi:MAG: FAD-binding oxidoreductase [Gemmataceae bacterium]